VVDELHKTEYLFAYEERRHCRMGVVTVDRGSVVAGVIAGVYLALSTRHPLVFFSIARHIILIVIIPSPVLIPLSVSGLARLPQRVGW